MEVKKEPQRSQLPFLKPVKTSSSKAELFATNKEAELYADILTSYSS